MNKKSAVKLSPISSQCICTLFFKHNSYKLTHFWSLHVIIWLPWLASITSMVALKISKKNCRRLSCQLFFWLFLWVAKKFIYCSIPHNYKIKILVIESVDYCIHFWDQKLSNLNKPKVFQPVCFILYCAGWIWLASLLLAAVLSSESKYRRFKWCCLFVFGEWSQTNSPMASQSHRRYAHRHWDINMGGLL